MTMGTRDMFLLLVVFIASVAIPGNAVLFPSVDRITPLVGSIQGATRLSIEGEGFSEDPFSFGEGNENRGNKVYLTNSTAAIECDVLAYWSNKKKIICDTRAASAGDYSLLLYVDGKEISQVNGKYCQYDSSRCRFRYTHARTPTIESVSSMSGTPGSKVNIKGRFFTDKFATTETGDVDEIDADNPIEIQRIYWGNYICNLVDPETDELYGIAVDPSSWGNVIVVPKGTFIESQSFRFLISGDYGRSYVTPESLRVSGQNMLYHYQTHAEITGVEPSSGSLAGGTVLTISGNYFYELAHTTVLVGGALCDIKSISDTAIECVTNQAPEAKTTYPGSRGILWERWFDDYASLEDVDWHAATYNRSVLEDSASTPFSEGESVGRLRGYFVPPRDGDYRFRIRGDDQSQLFFSLSGSEIDMNLICETPSAAEDWVTYPEQNATKLSLLGGTPYYLEARYIEGIVEVGVDMFDVPVAAGQIEGAVNEVQQILLRSNLRPENQTFSAVGAYEVQHVRIQYDGCNDTDALDGACYSSQVFRLIYDGTTTGDIFVGSSADVIASELSNLTPIPLTVSEHREYINTTYNITFTPEPVNKTILMTRSHPVFKYVIIYQSDQDLPSVSVVSNTSDLVNVAITTRTYKTQQVKIKYHDCNETEEAAGLCYPSEVFQLVFNGSTTGDIFVGSSADVIASELSNLTPIPLTVSEHREYINITYNGNGTATISSINYVVTFQTEQDILPLTVESSNSSSVAIEVQVDAIIKEQQVGIAYRGCNGTDVSVDSCFPAEVFHFIYNGSLTGDILVGSSADVIASELSNLTPIPLTVSERKEYINEMYNIIVTPEPVEQTVWRTQIDPVFNYVITFQIRQDLPLLSFETDDPSLVNGEVTEVTSGQEEADDTKFVLNYGGVIASEVLWTNSSAEEVEQVFLDMISVGCQRISTAKAYFLRDYEQELVGYEWGERVVQPYCGRIALLNPTYLFYAMMRRDDLSAAMPYRLDHYKKLCFAFKGTRDKWMEILMKYYTLSYNEVTESARYKSPELAAYDGYAADWEHTCINIHNMVMNQGSIRKKMKKSMPVTILSIAFDVMLPGEEFYIDNVYIGSANDMYQRVKLPAMPNGNFISDVTVTKTDKEFTVSFTPSNCGYDFPLLGFRGVTTVFGSADAESSEVIYTSGEFTPGTNIAVRRVQTAGLPLGGVFQLEHNGKYTTVSGTASAQSMKEAIESALDSGTVVVHREGSCSEYIWDVEWTSKGGSQPLLQINETGLLGTDIYHEVEKLREGYVFMGPIPGEFLRTLHDKPQVEVMVNHIPSVCAANASCSFSYDVDGTPVVNSVSPTTGSEYEGSSITISGSGFSTEASENNVTIGDAMCDVTDPSETTITCDVGPGQMGSYLVKVNIESRGTSVYPNGDVTFEYNADITSVNPASGSAVGGTQITISGYGFPCNDITSTRVMVGSKVCRIISVCYDEITCKIALDSDDSQRQKRATTADIVITIDNVLAATSMDAFTFDESLTATITHVSPTNASVLGGGNLVISGIGFGSSGAVIHIGDAECLLITQSDTEVVCAIPGNSPGLYDVELSIENKGFADTSSISQFEYQLSVFSMFPDMGSLHGDSLITITGEGFTTNPSQVRVQFGDIDCEIVTISDNRIECVTKPIVPIMYVDNQGKHQDYGKGYKWNPQLADITVGDIVYWQWLVPTYVTGIGFTIQQTSNAESTDYDGTGFKAGGRSPNGKYAYKFTAPGIYFYSSGPVDDAGSLQIKGSVRVSPKESFARKLTVFVGDYEAIYDKERAAQTPTSYGSCTPIVDPIAECNTVRPTESDSGSYYLAFWDCATPTITYITPNAGVPSTVIKIRGFGFGEVPCQNQIIINGHECVAHNTSSTNIECVIDTKTTFNVGNTYHAVELNVRDRGAAINRVMTPTGRAFRMSPSISGLSLDRGSAVGGMRLTIFGDGFSAVKKNSIRLEIGGADCVVDNFSYTQITCVTTEPVSALKYHPILRINNAAAVCKGECGFTYDWRRTPIVTDVTPDIISGPRTTLNIRGSRFGNHTGDITVTVGGVDCVVTYTNPDQINCNVGYVPAGEAELVVKVDRLGNSFFVNESMTYIWSQLGIDSVTPNRGSYAGGQLIEISGGGFHVDDTLVKMPGGTCITTTMNISHIYCLTPAYGGAGDIFIKSGGIYYRDIDYMYASAQTPEVTSVTPVSGHSGDSITISGAGFSTAISENTVTIDGVECYINCSASDSIDCDVGKHAAGTYIIIVHVQGKGYAVSSVEFEYELDISSSSPGQGSFGGWPYMEIVGSGFDDETSTLVTVCDNKCPILNISASFIACDVPANDGTSDTVDCDIVVTLDSGATASLSNAWQYVRDMTPVIEFVDPPRGGTGGGTRLTIVGTGFSPSGNKVYIAGTECTVQSESVVEIVCRTGAHKPSEKTEVRVEVEGMGIAKQDNASFYYVDMWSSPYTWGGLDPPIEGDFVIIPAGQTLLLDTDTPILKMLLIQGGSFLFDEADITLNSEHILLMDGGLLQIGTEQEPFQHKATIIMHGHVRSKELPMYGAKTLAVRHGTLELHGKPIPVTWTHLANSVGIGDDTMTLMKSVTWNVGDEIVIASTGHRHSMKENEMLTITGISDDGQTLTFSPPLKYNHTGLGQTIGGVTLETRAEVGLLTRNVVVRGSVHEEWTEKIEACDAEYNSNQFAIQTCFRGRFGEETASDEFGAQIMLFARQADRHWSTGRIEYVEVTHAGQAFRLGRYPIHFHLNGDITGNYVRGCAIHHTFNRAVTIHAVHHLLVEHNVAYNVMGHAFFLEDGIETKNIIQYNLAIFVRPSSSLLNTDVSPAAFWVTNADNYIRHNTAAGGSHYGFWYNAPIHPGGPSFTTLVCPRSIPVLEFRNNTCHTHGRYGLWVYPTYFPSKGGSCTPTESEPAEFYGLTAWSVERGVEGVELGNVRFIDFLISDAERAGIEIQQAHDYWGGPMVKNSVIIGWSEINEVKKRKTCTRVGLQLPKTRYFTVDGVKFINFDQSRCVAIQACAYCKQDQGGYQTRFQNVEFVNAPKKTEWKWQHECWLEDLDGSLSGESPGFSVLPYNPNLPSDQCTVWHTQYGTDVQPGAVCNATVKFHRMAFNEPSPSSLRYKRVFFTNRYGTCAVHYQKERLTHPQGWMLTVIDGATYNMMFEHSDHITNISYTARLDEFQDGSHVYLGHNFTQTIDGLEVSGRISKSSEKPLSYSNNSHGDWYLNNKNRQVTYLISGKGFSEVYDLDIIFHVYRCYFGPCTSAAPPTQPPPAPTAPYVNTSFTYWSNPETWKHTREGWGGNRGNGKYGLPVDGDDVMIMKGVHVVADTDFPVMRKLYIYGTLELEDTQDFNLTATYIVVQGGHLIIGKKWRPFKHNVLILLQGDHYTPGIMMPGGRNLGSKALGCFGGCDLHGKRHKVYWTYLATTAYPGDDTITVMEDTDWEEGHEIVVTTTSYETWHTETFMIENVADARTFRLNGTFQNKHISEEYTTSDGNVSHMYSMRAEVGLLTRNIKIEGAHYNNLFKESFGARVVVSSFYHNGEEYRGYASISDVEFFHTGQEGWTDMFDLRSSLSFMDTGVTNALYQANVKGCSFHNGFSTAIALSEAHLVDVEDNVIHHVVGPGIIDRGQRNRWVHNLVSLVIFPGTYQDRYEGRNLDFTGGFEVDEAINPVLIDNTVAGSERVGFKIQGEKCKPDGKSEDWRGNVAHGTLHGVFLFRTAVSLVCCKIAGFTVYRNYDFGINFQASCSLIVTDVVLIDNKAGLVPLVIGPNPRTHETTNQFVRFENSLVVGMSPGFDCKNDEILPESSVISKKLRGPRAGHGRLNAAAGHAGLVWPSFMAGANLAPVFPFQWVMEYPTLYGVTLLNNVTFSNFNFSCDNVHVMIMTNSGSDDFMHPMYTQDIHMVAVWRESMILYHRPDLRRVTPADCVDMDCDGMKKAMIQDMDGTLLGSPGTLIPDAAFEWDGDPRRGLGDYRIPKVMMTEPDGSRIPYEEKVPNKGIYRGHYNECMWEPVWRAYECHGIDYNVMIIESLDDDTEVRRISPVALYTDTYVDLINGPQDQGWCQGYTCQERISTFYSIVALNEEYELVFTGTNPQSLRFHLLDALNTYNVVVGIWYANPQRLDVYVDGIYIMPTNGGYDNGEFVWKNDLTPEEYKPSVDSDKYGENFFDRDLQVLYILLHGPKPVDIRTTPIVMVTFGVPAVTLDEFFEENLIQNLVGFLNVEASQIRIMDVIAEDSKRRRRRGAGEAEVVIEIGDPPASTIETPEDVAVVSNTTESNVTEATPTSTTVAPDNTTDHAHEEHSLNFDTLVNLQSTLANEMQSGSLGSALDIQITSMAMTDPEPEPVDPTGGVRATNESAGPSNGTETYGEHVTHTTADPEDVEPAAIVYRIPVKLIVYDEPYDAVEDAPFTVQPKINVLDAFDTLVKHLGTSARPWLLTASIRPGSGSHHAHLHGNTTLPFIHGWANFTNLNIDVTADDFVLDFHITYPNTSSLAVSSVLFAVTPRPYFATVVMSPGDVYFGEDFDVIVEVHDGITLQSAQNLDGKGYTWQVSASLYMPTNYRGKLVGDANMTFDLQSAQAHLADLSIDAVGYQYIIELHVFTVPNSMYDFILLLEPFDVKTTSMKMANATRSTFTCRFDADYDAVVAGKEELLEVNFLNTIGPMYPNVTMSNVNVTRGSILITFDMEGDVESAKEQLWDDLSDGLITLRFNGYTLTADPYLMVDGEVYDPEEDDEEEEEEEDEVEYDSPPIPEIIPTYDFLLPVWVVAVFVTNGIMFIVVLVFICYKCECIQYDKQVVVYLSDKKQRAAAAAAAKKYSAPEETESQKESADTNEPVDVSDLTDNVSSKEDNDVPSVTKPETPPSEVPKTPPGVVPQIPPQTPPTVVSKSASPEQEKVPSVQKEMYIMAKRSTGTFHKIASVNVNYDGSMYELRQSVTDALTGSSEGKKFVLLMETLQEIDASQEKKLTVCQVYSSDCVLIRWANDETAASKMCPCGNEGQFSCSTCHKQSYCSPKCQTRDWPRHVGVCSKFK